MQQILHSFRYLDTQQAHTQFDDLAHIGRERQTEDLLVLILFAQDAEVVIELIVFLYQLVAVVGNASRVVIVAGLLYNQGKVGQILYQADFLFAQLSVVRQFGRNGAEKTAASDNGEINAKLIVEALGGPDNIEKVDNCFTRLRLIVKDSSLVKDEVLKQQTGAAGVFKKNETVQVVYGLQINQVRKAVDKELGLDQ